MNNVPNNQPNSGTHILLKDDAAKLLNELAELQGISKEEALKGALATEIYLLRERNKGSKVLLQTFHNKIREVIFKR